MGGSIRAVRDTPKWVQAILAERGIDIAAFKGIPMYQIHA